MKFPLASASAALLLLCASHHGTAGVLSPQENHYWVGTGVGCSHATIQAAVDAAASNNNDVVHITRTRDYSTESVLVQDKNLVFQGGHGTCGDFDVIGTTTVSGESQPGTPLSVFRIRGASRVALRNLAITDGHPEPFASGGGISFEGTGELSLDKTEVAGNRADRGGGVALIAQDGPAVLRLGAGSVIARNHAEHGGVHVEGDARLFALVDGILIGANTASSSGGGLALAHGARADIGSPACRDWR